MPAPPAAAPPAMARRVASDRGKFVRATIGYAVAAVLIVWITPWGRNLVPWFAG